MERINNSVSDQIPSNSNQRDDYKSDSSNSSDFYLTSRKLDRTPSSGGNMTTTQRMEIDSTNINDNGKYDQEIDDSLCKD